MVRDLLLAFRWLRHNAALTLAMVAILGLGIAASTAIFSIVDPVLLRPLPYQAAGRLVRVGETTAKYSSSAIPAEHFRYWRDRAGIFDQAIPYRRDMDSITNVAAPDQVWSIRAPGRLFALIGARARLGRTLTESDDDPAAPLAAVLSDRLWRRMFNADPAIINRPITISGEIYTIAGVMPRDFEFAASGTDLWLPLRMTAASDYSVFAIARLKNGVPLRQAQAALDVVARELEQRDPRNNAGVRITVEPWREDPSPQYTRSLEFLLAAVGLVLMIACANTGSLLLSRAVGRQKEIAIRASIGAPLRRIVRQLLAESLAVALLSVIAGIATAYVTLGFLVRQLAALPLNIPHISRVALNGRVLIFDCVVCVLLAVFCSLAPALMASRTDIQGVLRAGRSGDGRRSRRLFSALVASEAAMAFLLLASSGLLIRSVLRLHHADNGFQPDHVLTLRVPIGTLTRPRPAGKYDTRPRQIEFYSQVLERLERIPQISAVALVNNPPLSSVNTVLAVRAGDGAGTEVSGRTISPQYFAAMGTPLVRGRIFSDADTANSQRVAIINEYLARRVWPDRDPLGQPLSPDDKNSPVIVGVVKNAWQYSYNAPIAAEVYIPYRQFIFGTFMSTFIVRSTADPASLVPLIRRAVWAVDPNEPVTKIATLSDVIDDAIWIPRFSAWIFSALGLMALALTCAGIYAVVAYTASLRAHEVGIRVALGAAPGNVVAVILRGAMAPLLAGLAVSVAAALLFSRVLAGLLYEISPNDPLTYIAAAGLLAGMGLLASAWPAWKAATADPLKSLRTE